jgi:uncharacterized DUF497 family protein
VAILFVVKYRWNDWNIGHIADHGMSQSEAEFIVDRAQAPYPKIIGQAKRLVVGQTSKGLYAQVIYVLDEDGTTVVIHGRPLTDREKRRYRRRRS